MSAKAATGVFVLAFRGPGDNFPSPVAPPPKSVLVTYGHDDDGGTTYLYEFTPEHERAAEHFADLTRGLVFDDEVAARDAYQEKVNA